MFSPMRCLLIVTFLAYVYCSHGAITATGEVALKLQTNLFVNSGYNKRIRPRINQSDVIIVNISLTVIAINELSEIMEMLKTTAFLSVSWYDEFLQWNLTDYGGLYYYQYPQADIWKPDVALKNSFLDYKELGVDSLNVEVFSDGLIRWYPFQVFQSTCEVDITYFPFDTQTCKLRFLAWSYSYIEVVMESEFGVSLVDYIQNPIWDVVESGWDMVNDSTVVSAVEFYLTLKRKPQNVILTVIMPILLLGVLNTFVFVLPSDSGEKASYAITVFLAFAVFLTAAFSTLPKNSNSLAIFSIFLIIQIIQSTIITLVALVIVRCSSFGKTVPVPKRLQIPLEILCCKTKRKKKRTGSVTPMKPNKQSEVLTLEQMDKPLNNHTSGSTDAAHGGIGDGSTESLREKSDSNQQGYTWKQAMNDLDRICFILFLAVFFMSLVTCSLLAAF